MATNTTIPEQVYLTLTAATVGTITLTEDYKEIEVFNFDGAEAVFFKVMSSDDSTDPAVPAFDGSDDIQGLPAAISSVIIDCGGKAPSGTTVIKFISSGTPTVSVKANHNV